ncbi:hypothetical protein Psuf_074860 [Phytohabitans suffuscus]|uniref:Amidase domain-containing protein n=1 Tax=Phytohabitans suffuscus TaxID=624315 RepID=A0A6F8YW04_9ACTN|nr:hypothetical protein Psuf_074860 [Phytohabitans suffuscus]
MSEQPLWTLQLDRSEVDELAGRVDPEAPLAGVRFAVKDNIDLAGHPTTAACPALATKPAGSSATAVRLLLEAGAVPVGKTNLDQFATGLVGTRSPYGACHSVASPAHVSGGSSSGSAVAVAGGAVPLALATDTAGSGRVPAAFNGIVGSSPPAGSSRTPASCPRWPTSTASPRSPARSRRPAPRSPPSPGPTRTTPGRARCRPGRQPESPHGCAW